MADSVHKIFISYRRDDNPDFVERVRDWFIIRYGRANVFMDFDSIPPFTKFADYIREKIIETDVMLVVIGPRWLELLRDNAANFREDFVRIEVGMAIEMGKIIAPICIKDASVPPRTSLPTDLQPLLDHNIAFLNSRDFLDSIEMLVDAVEKEFVRHNPTIPSTEQIPPASQVNDFVVSMPQIGGENRVLDNNFMPVLPIGMSIDDLVNRGEQKINQGDFDGAIADFTLVLQIDPNNIAAYHDLGNAQHKKGDNEEALKSLTRAIFLNPNSGLTYLLRGAANCNLGNYREAITDCNQAIRLNAPLLDQVYYIRGIAREQLKDVEGAIADYTESLEYNSYFVDAYWKRAEIYRRTRTKDQEAIADYDEIIALDPQYVDAYKSKVHIYTRNDQWDDVIDVYTELIENNPRLADAYIDRSGAYDVVGKYDEAIADCTKAIQLDPENAGSHYHWRGNIRQSKGDLNGAINDLTTAISLLDRKEEIGQIYEDRAKIFEIQEKYNRAVEDLQAFLDLEIYSTDSDGFLYMKDKLEGLKSKLEG